MPELKDVRAAHIRIAKYIHRTPVMTSKTLDKMTGANLFFKAENLQRGGAFKIRGATNAILQLTDKERSKGIIAHSSGNHAQAVALACMELGINATIVMPDISPLVKVRATRDTYGADVVLCENSVESRQKVTQQLIDEFGYTLVHAYDNDNVIAGAGTATLELLEEYTELDIVIAPVGGGGLLSGTSIAARGLGSRQVFGAEPERADDAKRSLHAGKIINNPAPPDTIADGLRTNLCKRTFGYISRNVDDVLTVSENQIKNSMRLVWERMKMIIEPSSAVVLAAAIDNPDVFKGKKVGLILSGGNVDLENFFEQL